MNHWYRAASLVKILFFEFIAIMSLGMLGARLLARFNFFGCPPPELTFDGSDLAFVLIGLAAAGWVAWRTLWPKLIKDSFRPVLKAGPLMLPNAIIPVVLPNLALPRVEYPFPSTNPAYVFIDLFAIGIALIFVSALGGASPVLTGCSNLRTYLFPWAALGLAVGFPLLRLFSWYILKRRLALPPEQKISAWKPIIILWTIAAIPTILILIAMSLQGLDHSADKLPLVNSETFAGGLAVHSEFNNAFVRLDGTLKFPQAARCGCEQVKIEDCIWRAGALLTVGDTEVLAVQTIDVYELMQAADNHQGKTIRLVGKLQPMPDPIEKPWLFSACGQETFGPGDAKRVYLQVEEPTSS